MSHPIPRSLPSRNTDARSFQWAAALARNLPVIVVILAGSTAAVTAATVAWLQLESHQRTEFQWVAQDRNRALKKGVEDSLDAIRSVGDLLQVDPTLNPEGFHLFASSVLERYRGIQSLEWLPRVSQRERAHHEAAGERIDLGYSITEHNSEGVDVRAGRRAEYFPVFYREPPAPAGLGLGFDRSSDPMQRTLIEQAIKSGEMAISGRVPLDPEHARFGVMVILPVFQRSIEGHPRPSAVHELTGVVVGILCLYDLANASITVLEPRGVEFLVLDESAPEGDDFLDFYTSRLGPELTSVDGHWQGWSLPESPRVTEMFPVANREWSITCARTQHYRSAEGFKEGPWIVLGSGMALTAVLGVFVYSLRRQMNARLIIEQELRASEQKLRVLFDQSPDIIMTVDEDAKILMVNRPWPKAPTESAVGRSSAKILPKGLRDWYRHALDSVFRTGEANHFQYSEPDSSWWEVRVVPLWVGGGVNAAMVIATDVTEHRLLEAQAIRTARFATLGVLAASVAHEINNPNSAIQFNASVLRKSFDDILPILRREATERGAFLIGGVPVAQALEGIPRMLEGLLRNAQRIQTIVGNLKHMARHDQGEYNEKVDLPKVLHSAYSILQHQIQKQTDQWKLELPPSLPTLRGNVQQLEQVFINLILNALQSLPFRSARLWVTVQTEPDATHVRVSVIDQGNGIKDDDLQRIFDPFFTTRSDQGGTGLGLSICQRIIQNHGGTIEINSQSGVGTEVTVRLPVAGAA
jgi:PAS domain S-box-containing protein